MTRTERCNGSSVTYTIDDTNGEITQIEAIASRRPVTIYLLADDGSEKAKVTVDAGQTLTRAIAKAQRVQATYRTAERADRTQKTVQSFLHRVQW